jgi:hypothetical protein
MRNFLVLGAILLSIAGCKGGWTAADQADYDKHCPDGSCSITVIKESKPNYCNNTITPIDCQKDNPNAGTGRPRPDSGSGNDNQGTPCTDGDCTVEGSGDIGGGGNTPGQGSGQGGTGNGQGGGIFKGTGDVLDHWGDEIGKEWEKFKGELNGSNAENRRKKREAKRLIREMNDLWAQADAYGLSIDNDRKAAGESWTLLEDSWKDFGIASREKDLEEFRGRYNGRTKGILDGIQRPDPSVFDGLGKGRGDGIYPEHQKIENGRKYLDYARGKLDPNAPDYGVRKTLVEFGDACLDEAESSYRSGNIAEGNGWYELGIAAADAALSLTPGVGWAKDVYEAWTGKSLLTGKQLTRFERSMAMVGAVTAGIAKVGVLAKAAKITGFIGTAAKTSEEAEAIAKIGTDAVEIAESAAKAGIKDKAVIDEVAEAVKDGLPCVALNSSPHGIWGLFVGTAYAGDCIPGSAEKLVKESLDNTKLTAEQFEYKLRNLPPGERVAEVKGTLTAKAKEHGWTKDRNVTKKNSRDVFSDKDGNYYAIDTQHGRYEKCNRRGKHQGEYDIDLKFIENSVDTTGGHDLIL